MRIQFELIKESYWPAGLYPILPEGKLSYTECFTLYSSTKWIEALQICKYGIDWSKYWIPLSHAYQCFNKWIWRRAFCPEIRLLLRFHIFIQYTYTSCCALLRVYPVEMKCSFAVVRWHMANEDVFHDWRKFNWLPNSPSSNALNSKSHSFDEEKFQQFAILFKSIFLVSDCTSIVKCGEKAEENPIILARMRIYASKCINLHV